MGIACEEHCWGTDKAFGNGSGHVRLWQRHESVLLNPDNPRKVQPQLRTRVCHLCEINAPSSPHLCWPIFAESSCWRYRNAPTSLQSSLTKGGLFGGGSHHPQLSPEPPSGRNQRHKSLIERLEMNAAREHWYHRKYLLIFAKRCKTHL